MSIRTFTYTWIIGCMLMACGCHLIPEPDHVVPIYRDGRFVCLGVTLVFFTLGGMRLLYKTADSDWR